MRSEFQRAVAEGHPAFDAAELSTVVTVVDSPHFFDLYSSKNDVADHAELLGAGAGAAHAAAAGALDASYERMQSVEVERSVVDLLVEQAFHTHTNPPLSPPLHTPFLCHLLLASYYPSPSCPRSARRLLTSTSTSTTSPRPTPRRSPRVRPSGP